MEYMTNVNYIIVVCVAFAFNFTALVKWLPRYSWQALVAFVVATLVPLFLPAWILWAYIDRVDVRHPPSKRQYSDD